MSKQSTLFQSWGAQNRKQPSERPGGSGSDHGVNRSEVINLCEEEDEDILLAMAMEESLRDLEKTGSRPSSDLPTTSVISNPPTKPTAKKTTDKPPSKQSTLFKTVGSKPPQASKRDIPEPMDIDVAGDADEMGQENEEMPDIDNLEDLPGFDKYAGRMWIYPTNYPVRQYQYSMVKAALLNNTMIVLPTGLGKTFVAAVVMYNYYRWYPQGKVIFMAPTKPLVAQQIEACYNIMGIPQDDTAEMTGAMLPAERKKSWLARRMFFLTPQVLTNDLSRSACPASDVKCLVVDEAHKALGNHAYCQVVRELIKHTSEFRILALSATPGSDIKAVQQVLNNLLISHIELRSEDSADIQQYTHERRVDKIVIPLGEELKQAKEKYLQVVSTIVMRLRRQGVLYNREPQSLSKFLILKAREAFRANPPQNLQRQQFGAIEGDFALCMSLYHGYELLQLHGLRSLFNFLEGIITGDKSSGRTRTELQKNKDFCDLMDGLRDKFDAIKCLDPNASFRTQISASQKPQVALGHPKMGKLQEVVLEHFRKYEEEETNKDGPKTRIMIFSQYRDSVNEITEMLNSHRPLVRVMSFVGQSSVGKTSRGFTQKEQLKVMKKFRDGGYNTLVSTCVGEEGLDIGDVDLIICFDAHKSPIRLVQRMGRTGRKREGRIVMLVTEGKEEQIYNQSQYNKRSIHKAILNGTRSLLYYQDNPRMLPEGLTPSCHKMHLTVHTPYQAKGRNNKVAAVPQNKARSNTTIASKRGKGGGNKTGFLTAQELQYWTEHYKIDEADIPTMPQSDFVTLNKTKQQNPPSSNELSLTEWIEWQNMPHTTFIVGHSAVTDNFVQLMQFTELQAAVGTNEDNYGMEMAMYLNDEDTLKPGEKNIVSAGNHGILKFCSTGDAADDHNVEKQRKTGSVVISDDENAADFVPRLNSVARIRRKTCALPLFSDDETPNDSDDDLLCPDLVLGNRKEIDNKKETRPRKSKGKAGPHSKAKNRAKATASDELQENNPDQQLDNCQEKSTVTRILEEGSSCGESVSKTNGDKSSTNKRTSNLGFKNRLNAFQFKERRETDDPANEIQPPDVDMENDEGNVADNEITRKVPRRKRNSSGRSHSILEVIKNVDDEDDFTPESRLQIPVGSPETTEVTEQITGAPEELDLEQNDENIPPKDNEESLRLSQLLPIFSPNVKHRSASDCSLINQRKSRLKKPRTPPPLEEVTKALGELERKGRLSPVDVWDLVDSWSVNSRVEDWSSSRNSISDSMIQALPTNNKDEMRGIEWDCSYEKMGSSVQGSTHGKDNCPMNDNETSEHTDTEMDTSCPKMIAKNHKQNNSWEKFFKENKMDGSLKLCDSSNEIKTAAKTSVSSTYVVVNPTKKHARIDNLLNDISYADVADSINESEFFKDSLIVEDTPYKSGPNNSSGQDKPFMSQNMANQKVTFQEQQAQNLSSIMVGMASQGFSHVDGMESIDFSEPFTLEANSNNCHQTNHGKQDSTLTSEQNKFDCDNYNSKFSASRLDNNSITHLVPTNSSTPMVPRNAQKHVAPHCGIVGETPGIHTPDVTTKLVRGLTDSHQSFFDEEDSIFEGVSFTEASDVKKPKLTSPQISPKAIGPTQMTFTQALACVHQRTFLGSDSSIASDAVKDNKSNINDKDFSKSSSIFSDKSPGKMDEPEIVNSVVQNEVSEEEKPAIIQPRKVFSTPAELDQPQFDLGFELDLDDFEDEMIPPSPEHVIHPISQRFSISATRDTTLASVNITSGMEISANTSAFVHNISDKVPCISNPHRFLPKQSKDESYGSQNSRPVAVIQPSESSATPKTPQIVQNPRRMSTPKIQTNTMPAVDIPVIGSPSEQPHITRCAENDPLPSNCIPFDPDGETLDVLMMDDDDLMQHDSGSDDDESIIQMPRKKKTAVLMSPDSTQGSHNRSVAEDNFKTPLKPAPKARETAGRKRPRVFSDEDSPLIRRVMKKAVRIQEPAASNLIDDDDDDDDDFVVPRGNHQKITKKSDSGWMSKANNESTKPINQKTKKPKKRYRGNGFIEEEAELSDSAGENVSSDEEDNSDLDTYDCSFINDHTTLSQAVQDPDDMRAVYLQSVLSPVARRGFKMSYKSATMDVFSQVPQQDSEYMEDSFCVNSDAEESDSPVDHSEVKDALDDTDLSLVGVRRTRRRVKEAKLRREMKVKTTVNKPKGSRRRVVQALDSSSEDETQGKFNETAIHTSGNKVKGQKNEDKPQAVLDSSKESPKENISEQKLGVISSDTSPEVENSTHLKTNQDYCNSKLEARKKLSMATHSRTDSRINRHNQGETQVNNNNVDSPVVTGLTQMPSLMSRCRRNLTNEQTISSKLSDNKPQKSVTMPSVECEDTPNFTLGLEDFCVGEEESDNILAQLSIPDIDTNQVPIFTKPPTSILPSNLCDNSVPQIQKSHSNAFPQPPVSKSLIDVSPDHNITELGVHKANRSLPFTSYKPPASSSHCLPPGGGTAVSPPSGISREERLRLSRLKQEEFKKKFTLQKRTEALLSTSSDESSVTSPLVTKSSISTLEAVSHSSHSTHSSSSNFTQVKDRLVVLVDSREISGAQDLVSMLRFKHHMHASVKSLGHCDYILSNRMAVERKVVSDFTDGTNKAKLLERVRILCELFDRPCIVIEQDRIKPGEEKKAAQKTLLRSKYVEHMLAGLAQTHIKVLYSENQEETASLLSELAQQEQRKDMAVNVPVELSDAQEQVLKFYLSLPKVSYILALNLLHKFRTIQDFIRSPVGFLEKKGQLSRQKSQEIHAYLRHTFDAQMMRSGQR